MKIRARIDVTVEIDPPSVPWYCSQPMEQREKYLKEWAKDFEEFVRDHRSQDPIGLSVKAVYEEICSHCKCQWEEDEDGPLCCNKALQEWIAARTELSQRENQEISNDSVD